MLRTVLLVAALLGTAPALAGQEDPRLDPLFERLQQSDDPAEISTTEALIWEIWLSYTGDNDDVRRLMRRGIRATNGRDLASAEALFAQVIELAPDFAEGWNRRATVRYMRGDYHGSIGDIRATLALEPRHFGALSGLGLCYSELEDSDLAIAAFEAALAINPHMRGARASIDYLRNRMEGDPI